MGDHICKRRLDLSHLQKQVADQIGLSLRTLDVDETTLQGWEAGRQQPTGKSVDTIERVLRGSVGPS